MAMRFDSLDNLFKSSRAHLDAEGGKHWGTEIENHFVQLILVRICAEYEVRLKELMARRLRSNDGPTVAFARALMKERCKKFKVAEVSGILGDFGETFKTDFSQRLSAASMQEWDNINQNRHTVAHKTESVQMTFIELESAYKESLKIWDEIINVLGFRPKELKGLR